MANITVPGLPAKTGTILDAAYLHLNESSVDKKVTIAQLLAKIEAQYSADIVTFLESADKAEGRANLSIDRRVEVNNDAYSILVTDKIVSQVGTMSAARIFSLPSAASFPAGGELVIGDESGSVTSTNKITIERDGTDTIDGATSIDIDTAYGFLKLVCNGSDGWKISSNQIASQTEANAGTNHTKFLTPLTASLLEKPAFSARRSASQTLSTGVLTKIQFDSEDFDNKSWYDNSTNYRYTPQRAGLYLIILQCIFDDITTGNNSVEIQKNGSLIANNNQEQTSDVIVQCSVIAEMNGSTDYIEGYAIHNSGSNKDVRQPTFMQGIYLGG